MHYLVTGAQGFLGAQVVTRLRAAGAVVTATGRRAGENVIRCDLSEAREVARIVEIVEPDCIVHCAASVPQALGDYQDLSSAQTSRHMLDNVLMASACPIVFISSMTVYGTPRDRPIAEHEGGDPTSAYGNGKWLAERRLVADGRPAILVRIPGLFGPTRRNGLVYNIVRAAKFGLSPQLPNAPVLWAAMHVDDAVESIVRLAVSPITGVEAVNIGYRGAYSIENLVSVTTEIFGTHFDYYVKHPSFEFDLTQAAIRNAVPKCSFREALVKFARDI